MTLPVTDSPAAAAPGFLLYLHGFNSSPASSKAQQLRQYWQSRQWDEQLLCIPALPLAPAAAMQLLETCLHQALRQRPAHSPVLMGSSLGGYYATWLAEQHNLPAVLINPAVRPHELLQDHLGPQRNYHTGEYSVLGPEHLAELKQLDVPVLRRPDNFLLLVQTGDETLDYRQAVEKYQGSARIIQDGGSHGFDHFDTMLPEIMAFFRFVPESGNRT